MSRRRVARGQGLAEYALILALIALCIVIGLLLLGGAFGSSVSLATPAPGSPVTSPAASPGASLGSS